MSKTPQDSTQETVTITTEGHYAKQPDGFVYYYWRIKGSNTWNSQKTALREVPIVEMEVES